MKNLLPLFVLTLFACSPHEAETIGGDDNQDQAATSHRDAVTACVNERTAKLESAASTADMSAVLLAFQQCVAAANDRSIAALDKVLAERGSRHAGMVRGYVDDWRQAAQTLCPVLGDAASSAGTLGSTARADCAAQREHDLALLLDARAALGATPQPIADDRANYPACYEERDKSAGQAEAAHTLASCLFEAVQVRRVPVIASKVVANFPDRDPVDVQSKAKEVVTLPFDTAEPVCGALIDSDPDGSGDAGLSKRGECLVDSIVLVDDYLGMLEAN